LAHQQVINDFDKLKQEEAEKSARLQELMYVKPPKNTKLTNDLINTKLATPNKTNNKLNNSWIDERRIEHICDYYDELQYNYDYFNSKDCCETAAIDNNKSPKCLTQYSQMSKLRKNILNRKLIDHRQRLKCGKLKTDDEKSVASLSSIVDSLTIPSLHFHLILSLTMVILTHQCPHYLLVV